MPLIETPGSPQEPKQTPVTLMDERLVRVGLIIGWMLITGGILAGLYIVWPVIRILITTALPFAVGLLFAYIFDPVVSFVQKRLRLSRIGGVIILYGLIALAVVGFFWVVLPILATQVQNAYYGISDFFRDKIQRNEGLRELITTVTEWIQTNTGIDATTWFVQAAQGESVQQAAKSAATSGARILGDVLAFALNLVSNVFGIVTFLVLAFLVNLYLLLDFSKLRDLLEVLIPDRYAPRTFEVLAKVDVAVGGFIRGMLIDAFLTGLITFIGMYFLGLREYALLIGIITAIGNFIPYLGPVLGGTPAILYVLFADDFATSQERFVRLALVIAFIGLVQFIEGFIFQPKIVGKNAQLHPLAVLFALALGANFGLLGMIVAVPLACVVRVLLKEFWWDEREDLWKQRTGKPFFGYYPSFLRRSRESVKKPDA